MQQLGVVIERRVGAEVQRSSSRRWRLRENSWLRDDECVRRPQDSHDEECAVHVVQQC